MIQGLCDLETWYLVLSKQHGLHLYEKECFREFLMGITEVADGCTKLLKTQLITCTFTL